MSDLQLINLTERQAEALKTELPRLDIFHGLYFGSKDSEPDVLVIWSDGWTGEVRIDADGNVQDFEFVDGPDGLVEVPSDPAGRMP